MALTAREQEFLDLLLLEDHFQEHAPPRVLNGEPDRPGPLFWLQECTETYDEHWVNKDLTSPYAKFPKLPYWPRLFWFLEHKPRILIPKSREMMLSWAVVGYGVWHCQLFPRTRVIVQTQKEDKAIALVTGRGVPGYARTLYDRQTERMKQEFPLTKPMTEMPANEVSWGNESVIMGVPCGADQVRTYHPTIMMFDEAAHLDEFEAALAAAEPVCAKIIAVSSVVPGASGIGSGGDRALPWQCGLLGSLPQLDMPVRFPLKGNPNVPSAGGGHLSARDRLGCHFLRKNLT
jgi:hypothetical protein